MSLRSAPGLALALTASVQLNAASPNKARCGTRLPSDEEITQMEQRMSKARGRSKADRLIPVWVHVITKQTR